MCSCRRGAPSCTPTSTRSTRRSSSATTRRLRGRPVVVGGGRGAGRQLRGQGLRRAHGHGRRPGPGPVPAGRRGDAPLLGLRRGQQGRVRGVRRHDPARRGPVDRRGVPRRRRPAAGLGHAASRSRCGCGARCATGSGCRSPWAWPAPSSWPRWPARWPSPTACSSCRPTSELAFLHPLPVERLWGVGAVTADQAPRPRHQDGGRGGGPARGGAGVDAGPGVGPPPPRPGPQPRSPARRGRPAPAVDRLAVGPRPAAGARPQELDAVVVGIVDRVTRRMRAAGPGRAHRRAAAALRRLHPRHPLAHPRPGDGGDPAHPAHRPGADGGQRSR